MKQHKYPRKKLSLASVAILMLATLMPALSQSGVYATQIVDRSLTLLPPVGSAPGTTVDHLFEFQISSESNIGSIRFEYCTTAAAVPDGIDCNAPAGLDATGASVNAETGATGFTVSDTELNEVVISRASASTVADQTILTYRLNGILNPSNTNETFYVRITTHSDLSAASAPEDWGTVAASTATQIELSGIMPESLVFCTGGSIDTTGGVPDCTTATSGSVSFDRLFSSTDTATAISQMAASTNAGQGYAITVNGPTLTSGSNTINPMDDGSGNSTGIVLGTSQFGMNLVENTITNVNEVPLGLDVSPAPNTDNYRGIPTLNYNTADLFKFEDGDILAESNDGGAGGSDAQIFTKSYIVNVPGSQPAGTYNTTLTYICTATF